MSREFEVLERIRDCENCVQMLDIYYSRNEDGKNVQNVVFEYCSESLEDVIQSHK